MSFVFDPGERPAVEIDGSQQRFPVHRIYCVGQNYAAHAREMDADPKREPPFFFLKPADAIVPNGVPVPYPPRTQLLHHEIELVVAIGTGGEAIPVATACDHIFGYAVGMDLTRRDLQSISRKLGHPWDTSKAFDLSAPITAIHRIEKTGVVSARDIWLKVNGEVRQEADVADMIWSVPEVIAELSTLFKLRPGDLIFTGTPAGVGPLRPGDRVEGVVAGIDTLRTRIV